MANWQRYLNVSDVWDSNDVKLVARVAAERLSTLLPLDDYPFIEDERIAIVEELNEIADSPSPSVIWFDEVWTRLYDWADTSLDGGVYRGMDTKTVCWISTQEWMVGK